MASECWKQKKKKGRPARAKSYFYKKVIEIFFEKVF